MKRQHTSPAIASNFSVNKLLKLFKPLSDNKRIQIINNDSKNNQKIVNEQDEYENYISPESIINIPKKIKEHETFKNFAKQAYDFNSLEGGDRELANFIIDQLAVDKGFKGLDLLTKPMFTIGKKPIRMDAYNAKNKKISISPFQIKENPLIAFMHEATHRIDNAFMKTYQKEAIDFLAKHLGDKNIKTDKGLWYTGAQNILPNKNFLNAYPYKDARDNIYNSYLYAVDAAHNLMTTNIIKKIEDEGGVENFQGIDLGKGFSEGRFKDAADALSYINQQGKEEPNDQYFFNSLSEFPAFAVESLSTPWKIDWKKVSDKNSKTPHKMVMTNPNDNLGRKFLKKITKGVYKNFSNLNEDFSNKYPQVHENFIKRMLDLRNKDKYPKESDYILRLMEKEIIPKDLDLMENGSKGDFDYFNK